MSKSRRALAAATAAVAMWAGPLASLAGCDHKPPPAPSRGMPALDPLAAEAPAPKSREEHAPVDEMAQAMPPGHPTVPGGAHMAKGPSPHGGDSDPALEAASPGDIQFDAKTVIAGVLKLDPKVKDKVATGDVIYLVARKPPQGATPGPVVAVRRLEAGTFPMSFQLDSRDAMMAGGIKMEGPLLLTARVDKDGDAMTKNPGDVTGTLTLKALPAPKAALTLDTVL